MNNSLYRVEPKHLLERVYARDFLIHLWQLITPETTQNGRVALSPDVNHDMSAETNRKPCMGAVSPTKP